jgi:glucosamine--fructose-6-phosphate aminotransferase (isomerizing)
LTKPRAPFRTFYEQEIEEQPESILKVMGNGARLSVIADHCKLGGLDYNAEQISEIENMMIIACGSSFIAGLYALKFFKLLRIFNTVSAIEASEFSEEDMPREKGGAILISQSGETADVYRALKACKNEDIFTMGVINTVGSLIATNVRCGVYLHVGREVAVAATKSFICQIIALIMMAVSISYHKHHEGLYFFIIFRIMIL